MTQRGRARSNPLCAIVRLLLFLAVCFTFFGGFVIARLVCPHDAAGLEAMRARFIHRWGKLGLRLWGIRITIDGEPPAAGALLAPNHSGYADILAVAAATPCFFVTKPEVIGAPVAGTILRFFGIPAVRRSISQEITGTADRLVELFRLGQSVCVFLEGTSTGGDRLLPFRPAMCQAAVDARAPIQPVAMTWSSTNPGVDVGEDIAYWRDEHTMGPHIIRFLGLQGTRVHLRFGVPFTDYADRKDAARRAREAVLALLGREEPLAP
ncbi:MAG: hypothetical protein PWP23_1469 [Candidatus Sumerlaeota bacterium]|nr:hypothetical protein [Candidatus Sumerlaeota bacterium]